MKSERIIFRITTEERNQLDTYLEERGYRKSAFIREAVFDYMSTDKPEVRRALLDELKKMNLELRNAGNNLNQLAYRLNSGHPVSTPQVVAVQEDLIDLFAAMADYFRRMKRELAR